MRSQSARGVSRVICFSPDHSKTLPELTLPALEQVIAAWQAQTDELGKHYPGTAVRKQRRGDGLLQPAPARAGLGQQFLPNEAEREDRLQHAYFREHASRCCWTMRSASWPPANASW